MKKFITPIFLFSGILSTNAAVIPISVANFSFTPSTVNAVVGDVIQFNWINGAHTATCGSALPGTTKPSGAADFDSPINSSTTSFSYTVTVAGSYFYGCIPHFGGGTGMTGTIQVSSALPVSFGSLKIAAAENHVNVLWSTFTEQNTDYFSVRKSTDGIRFTEVGKVTAAGNSTAELSYSYKDATDINRNKYLYYEIVTVDKDRKESHSEIKLVRTRSLSDILITEIGPVPVTKPQMLRVAFNADGRGQMNVKVYSATGKLVLNNTMETFTGLNNAHLHVCDLPPGQYVAVFNLKGKKESKKIIIR